MLTKPSRRRLVTATGGVLAAASILIAGAGTAAAQSQTGWVGGTPPTGGIVYLHSSTITDSPALSASSVVYPSFGQAAPAFRMGVQARLFKSGVLCKINPYIYNTTSTARLQDGTSGNCGSGSYNSNGFISVDDGENTTTPYVTFPSNPINYTAPASRSAAFQAPKTAEVAGGKTATGQTFGSAAKTTSSAAQPDLVLAYGSTGQVGYVRSKDIENVRPGQTSVGLFNRDGTTSLGEFTIGK